MKLTKTTLMSPILGAGTLFLCAFATGCKKEEPPPPLPAAQPAATAATLNLKAIDAAVAPLDAGKEKPKRGTGGGGSSIAACCSALQQNANLAPEPTKTYMMQAAAYCQSAQAGGQAALGMIRGMLRGANMPSACK